VFALLAILLIENVTPEDDETRTDNAERPEVLESNPKQYCFTEGDSGLIWNTPRFQYCSTDLDCKGIKKPGWFSDWEYPICMDLQPDTPFAKGTYGICCNEKAVEVSDEE